MLLISGRALLSCADWFLFSVRLLRSLSGLLSLCYWQGLWSFVSVMLSRSLTDILSPCCCQGLCQVFCCFCAAVKVSLSGLLSPYCCQGLCLVCYLCAAVKLSLSGLFSLCCCRGLWLVSCLPSAVKVTVLLKGLWLVSSFSAAVKVSDWSLVSVRLSRSLSGLLSLFCCQGLCLVSFLPASDVTDLKDWVVIVGLGMLRI